MKIKSRDTQSSFIEIYLHKRTLEFCFSSIEREDVNRQTWFEGIILPEKEINLYPP